MLLDDHFFVWAYYYSVYLTKRNQGCEVTLPFTILKLNLGHKTFAYSLGMLDQSHMV